MSKVFVNMGMSLDGYLAPDGMTMENPGYKNWGTKWGALMGWKSPLRPCCSAAGGVFSRICASPGRSFELTGLLTARLPPICAMFACETV